MASSRRSGERRRDDDLLQRAGAMHGERVTAAWRTASALAKQGRSGTSWWPTSAPAERRRKPASTRAKRCGGRRTGGAAQEAGEHAGEALRGQARRAGGRFPSASIQGSTRFLNQQTVSSDLILFPYSLTCHAIFFFF
jgi:hypothetical protein